MCLAFRKTRGNYGLPSEKALEATPRSGAPELIRSIEQCVITPLLTDRAR